MKTIGIQIKGAECIIAVLEKKGDDIKLLKESKKLILKNHHDSNGVKYIKDELFMTFDAINPERIGVIVRQHKARKGQNPPSPLSFKIEGLIQLYPKTNIEFIWPQGISAHFKKNKYVGVEKYGYQKKAAKAAQYLLEHD